MSCKKKRVTFSQKKCSIPCLTVEQWEGEPNLPTSTLISSVKLNQCDKLQLWSMGSIDLNLQRGSAQVNIEANNIVEGDTDPTTPPPGRDRPAMFCNRIDDRAFIWDTVTQTWRPMQNSSSSSSLSLTTPRFQTGNLMAGQTGESGFENQDVLRLLHNIPDPSSFTNLMWIIGKQKIHGGYNGFPDSHRHQYEDFSGSASGTPMYKRDRIEGIPVTESGTGDPLNFGRLSGQPKNKVPVTSSSNVFQAIDINWWDWFSGSGGSKINPTDSQAVRRNGKPRGRRRGGYSSKSLFLRAYLRADNPNYTVGGSEPRWIYSGPSNEIVISNVRGTLRISHVKIFS